MTKVQVLVADDHGVIRNGLKKILDDTPDLEFAGEACDGKSVLEKVRERSWDMLILDLSMPGRNGLELIKLIKEARPPLPILIFSMHQEEQYAVRALRVGASGYLTKEFDGDLLLSAIRKVASGGVYVSPNCRGPEKVVRMKQAFGDHFRLKAAYGDTTGDREMIAMAETSGYQIFKGKP